MKLYFITNLLSRSSPANKIDGGARRVRKRTCKPRFLHSKFYRAMSVVLQIPTLAPQDLLSCLSPFRTR
jgi:hypothetical protein